MTGERRSDCCGDHVKVVGNAGCNYYTCDCCGKPCETDIDDGECERRKPRKRERDNE